VSSDAPFNANENYKVHHDSPRTNGSDANGAQRLSAEQELIAALLTNPALLAVVADIGLEEAHFARGTGFRGAFRFAPQGAQQIREILKKGHQGTTFDVLALLVELSVRISEQRAEDLARAIIAGAESRRDSSEKDEQSGTASTTHKEKRNIHGWDSPDWSMLDERRGTLPEFPLDTMPLACRDWISRAAYGAG
jgi:hypothetical protein